MSKKLIYIDGNINLSNSGVKATQNDLKVSKLISSSMLHLL